MTAYQRHILQVEEEVGLGQESVSNPAPTRTFAPPAPNSVMGLYPFFKGFKKSFQSPTTTQGTATTQESITPSWVKNRGQLTNEDANVVERN